MGKKQHQSDKLYLTCTEWKNYYGGKKTNKQVTDFKRLPFTCCSLSMQPFEHPYCTPEGVIFDLMNIVPFLKEYGVSPVNGEKMSAKNLIKLNFHKSSTDTFHCPVTFKVFNENTHIVAIRPTGNVFCLEAIEKLNITPHHWKDLLTDEPFARKDIIEIQDPKHLDKFNIADFYHIRNNVKVLDDVEIAARKHRRYNLKVVNSETKEILNELDSTYVKPEKKIVVHKKADHLNAASYSQGRVAAGFTSTVMDIVTEHTAGIIAEDDIRYARIKVKSYVRLNTTCGPLNLELHSDIIPKASENFLKLCKTGYYDDTKFHRSMRNFMIQGGDPDGTGLGGQSCWDKPFPDHFVPHLQHSGRGILSMANSGENTNKSQFFITFRSCNHLNGKHTIFGRLVGGVETLTKMENIETDKKDRPKKEIKIVNTTIFVDPYEEVDEQMLKERENASNNEKLIKLNKPSIKEDLNREYKKGVGKYINPAKLKDTVPSEPKCKKSKPNSSGFGNFSNW